MNDLLGKISTILSGVSIANIFLSTQPTDVADCVTLSLVDGNSPSVYFGGPEGIKYPFVQVIVRNASASVATNICEEIKKALHVYFDEDIAGILQSGDTMTLGRDPHGRMEMLLNFRLLIKE